jgi:hypothetical protein
MKGVSHKKNHLHQLEINSPNLRPNLRVIFTNATLPIYLFQSITLLDLMGELYHFIILHA